MTIPAPDPQTFHWIKGALDGSMSTVMSQVRLVEQDSDYAQLTPVPGNLHQINGSLRMVELDGAGILAEDLEALCLQICGDHSDVERSSTALGVLVKGLETLQTYVDAISRQTPVSPLGLADQINSVRKITGRPAVSRFDLFEPPLDLLDLDNRYTQQKSAVNQDGSRRLVPDALRVRLVTQLRRKYRRALLSWLASKGSRNGNKVYLKRIEDLLQHLFKISSLDISQQLWWVAGGFVEAVASGDLDANNRIKTQFARLDIEISRLEDENTSGIAVDPPDQLLRQMLFYIGAIEGTESARVREIQDALHLTEWFDRDDSEYRALVDASAQLHGLGEEFGTGEFKNLEQAVNDYFASFAKLNADSNTVPEPGLVLESLDILATEIKQVGPASLEGLLEGLAEAVRITCRHPAALASTQADIKIASALLFIRDSIASPDEIDATWQQSVDSHLQELQDLAGSSQSDSERALRVRKVAEIEYQHARSAVATLVRETLAGLEALLTADSAENQRHEIAVDALLSGSEKLVKTASVLAVAQHELGSQVAAKLAARLAQFGASGSSPGDDNLEHMAFAVAALGVAADHLSRSGPVADNVLRAALDRLDEVDTPPSDSPAVTDVADSADEGDGAQTVGEVQTERTEASALQSLIDILDYQRRQLNAENHNGVRALMESFEALSITEEAEAPVQKLAAMGQTICSSLLDTDSDVTPEKHDFIGLLVRQIKDLVLQQANNNSATDAGDLDTDNEQNINIDAWQRRVLDLTDADAANPADRQTGSEADRKHAIADIDLDFLEDDEADFESYDFDNDEDAIVELTAPGLAQLDLDLRTIFVEELGSHLQKLQQGLNSYRATEPGSPEATQALSDIDDCVHTLSGNCRNLGFDEAADCAEAAVSVLGNDRSVDRNPRLAHFAESLILLGQARHQIKEQGKYDTGNVDSLNNYVARSDAFHDDKAVVIEDSEDGSAPDDTDTENADGQHPDVIEPAFETADETSVQLDMSADPEPTNEFGAIAPVEQSQVGAEHAAADNAAEKQTDDQIEDDIDEEIRQIFIEESESILSRINGHLLEWRAGGDRNVALGGVRREFHTLKGSAAATGFNDISALSHRIESLLESQPLDSQSDDDEQSLKVLDLLEEMHDGLAVDLGIMQSAAKGQLPKLDNMIDQFLGIEIAADTAEPDIEQATDTDVRTDEPAAHEEPDEPDVAENQSELAQPVEPAGQSTEIRNQDRLYEPEQTSPLQLAESTDDAVPGYDHLVADDVAGNSNETDTVAVDVGDDAIEIAKSWMPALVEQASPNRSSDDAASGSMLRIGNNRLAELINASGELSLVRTQLQDTLDATRMDLDVLRSSMSSMRAGLRDLELEADAQIRSQPEQQTVNIEDDFDPLQLDRYSRLQAKSREVTELLDQLGKVERDLGNRASNLDGALRQQLHLGDQLQSGLMSARMVSMGDYLPRLRYLVRETSRQAGKPIELKFKGGDILVDRQVIETMMAPFEHMIRNAVAHGIEDSKIRQQAGKSESGTISLSLSQQGSELVVSFADDGCGLNLQKLQARAVDLGLADNPDAVTDVDLLQVITQPGYSTAAALTMESGRGVGMDVVYQAVRDLGGSMTLDNQPGQGVHFQFRLPVTLALTQALLVRVSGWRFAVRSRTIERLMRVSVTDVFEQDGERMMAVDDHNVTLFSVRERLGEAESTTSKAFLSVMLVRLADRLAAFEVDEFEDSVNIVSKTSGRQLASIPEISGVTVLGDSTIVLILDPEAFIDRIAPLRAAADEQLQAAKPDGVLRRVLVVDDSLVVRKVMQKDLEADGLDVESAVDGINALEVLERTTVDVALVDIEMPRMNGYELLEKLRSDERYQALPVIIITSRSGDQHRQRAMSLGADGYITKPYDITVLDELMRKVVANKRTLH